MQETESVISSKIEKPLKTDANAFVLGYRIRDTSEILKQVQDDGMDGCGAFVWVLRVGGRAYAGYGGAKRVFTK